jgi:uncharacterized protein (DUF2141 family)
MNFRFKINSLLLAFLIITGFGFSNAQEGDIVVEVSGLRNPEGNLCLALFDAEDGFPGKPNKTTLQQTIPITSKKMVFTLPKNKYGRYALSIVHDENKNNKLDLHFLGFPKEGYGASNNKTSNFGPPKFSECAFSLNTDTKNLKIKIHYFMKK